MELLWQSRKVGHIGDQVHDMKNSVDDPKAMMTRVVDRKAVTASSAEMPVLPAIFIGRDAVVNNIADYLVSDEIAHSRVFILAPGALGHGEDIDCTGGYNIRQLSKSLKGAPILGASYQCKPTQRLPPPSF